MTKLSRYPIASALILALTLVAALSVLASFYTLWMTSVLSGDASAVNLSGSLRMQSYRLAYAIERQATTEELDQLLQEFEERLTSPLLKGHIPSSEVELSSLFKEIESHFQIMKTYALTQPDLYVMDVENFVEDIDYLVEQLEGWSESKVDRLRHQQLVINLITLAAASLFMLIIFYRVILPLQRLLHTVLDIRRGKRNARVPFKYNDEFGELSLTFNQMADEIANVQDSLESTIEEQTRELSRNNHILEFLFNLSQSLSTEKPDIKKLKEIVVREMSTLCPQSTLYWTHADRFSDKHQYVVKCNSDRSHLVCRFDLPIEEWQIRSLHTVCDLFDNALNRLGSHKNENRIALLNERSSIARELHDSLAQQLSYLKIQVVRFVKLKERNADDGTLNDIINELRNGLNSSYRKLRELLVTFRAHLDEPGLVPSVKATADELNQISPKTKIHLYIDDNWPTDLSPSEEIHCLHVIREALTNVIKHANAENAVVSMKVRDDKSLEIRINDDGIGFEDRPEKPMHYGLQIMSERAERINGVIEYRTLKFGGAGVCLSFIPELAKVAP